MSEAQEPFLQEITDRLEALSRKLAEVEDNERAAELVQEASKLAAEAGEEVDRALREASGSPGTRATLRARAEQRPVDVPRGPAGAGRLLPRRSELRRRRATEGLEEAMRYSLLAGGKRIRPVLALATARAIGTEPERVLPAAAAIELIHTYSLIHDDLPAMDDDELRRGMPTSHVKFGENVAILAGDGLFAEAMRVFTEHQEGEPDRVLAALGELVARRGSRGWSAVSTSTSPSTSSTPTALRDMHALKTGRLIAASVGVVLVLGWNSANLRQFRTADSPMSSASCSRSSTTSST